MGSDNGYASSSRFCSAGRIAIMVILAAVFVVFVAKSNDGNSSLFGDSEPSQVVGNDNHDRYESFDWRDLPRDVKGAAMKLGWTPRSWDHSTRKPPVYHRPWNNLNDPQKGAAMTLGYDKASWNQQIHKRGDSTQAPSAEETDSSDSEDVKIQFSGGKITSNLKHNQQSSFDRARDKLDAFGLQNRETSAPTGEDTEESESESEDGDPNSVMPRSRETQNPSVNASSEETGGTTKN